MFRSLLAKHGITVGATRFAATPSTAHLVARDYSDPLSELLEPFLKLSNNMMAEALTKALGVVALGDGSWSAGTAAILADAAANDVASDTLHSSAARCAIAWPALRPRATCTARAAR